MTNITATSNGAEYRVIYTAQGNLWAHDVISNPPKPKKRYTPNAASFATNAATAVMVYKIGVKRAAVHYGISYMAVIGRVRRLQGWLGYRIFPDYDYSRLTRAGLEFIEQQGAA